jgi:hypothetical protein
VEASIFALSPADFFGIVTDLTDVAGVFIRISEVAERGSPLRLSRIDLSAYSLTCKIKLKFQYFFLFYYFS